MPFASVYPLVTARAVARAFTYEVDEDVGVGAIVRVPFGRSRARGIVVSLRRVGPAGCRRTADRIGARRDPAVARRARALARRLLRLDAGPGARARRARGAEAPQGAGAAGRAAGARRRSGAAAPVGAADASPSTRIVDGARRRRGEPAALRRDRLGQDRGLPPGVRGGARARPRRDRARAGDRARAADGRPVRASASATASRSCTRRSPTPSAATSARASRAARRGSSSARAPRSSRRSAGSA